MKKARLNQSHRVGREQLSVREHMTAILRKLGDGSFVMFDALLVKEKLVEVTQNEAFAPIYVKLADGTPNDA